MTFMNTNEMKTQPRRIKARMCLQEKIGTGQIDPKLLEQIQDYLDNVEINYREIAEIQINKINEIFSNLPRNEYDREFHLGELIKPIMELKATGGVFNEKVISSLSGMLLGFLENVKKLDDDMVDIVKAHNKAVEMALTSGIRTMDDQRARILVLELKQACMRYYQRYKEKLK